MRSALHNWFLRCAALLIFISGGALARAVAQEIETHFAPLQSPIEQKHLKAVAFEVRQPAPVQLEAGVLPTKAVPPKVSQTKPSIVWLELVGVAWVVWAFDALAPPQS